MDLSWFSPDGAPALCDFWAVYDANFDAVIGTVARLPAEGRSPLVAGAYERLRRAMAGDWSGYEDHLRAQAAAYARQGLSFGAWSAVASAFYRFLAPLLVRAYAHDPDRLSAALVAMNAFGSHAMAVLGESYIREREAMSRESTDESDRARQRAERRLARLVESGILGIIVARLPAQIIEINDAALAMVGYTRDEILSGSVRWTDLTPPQYREVDARVGPALEATGVAGLREKEYVHRDGHRVPVLVGTALVDAADGELIAFVLDLTERKRAEATVEHLRAIRAGEEIFRTLVDAVTDYAIFVLDPHGRIMTWNRGAQRLKGYDAEEIVGQHFSVFYSGEDIAADMPGHALAIAAREDRAEFEGWRLWRDGSRFWADVVISAMRDSSGRVLGFAKVTRDLTARRAAAQALSDANRELEAFSYSVAHDLRAPLRGMSGFAQVLLDTYADKLDAEGQDCLQEIISNAKKMGGLIDALLSLGRVTRTELSADRLDLSTMAVAIVGHLAAAEPERVVTTSIAPDLWTEMDPSLGRALLENLLANAWKFSGRTAAARIEVGAIDASGERAFFVRDNGAGFDMAHAGKLFTPFQRLHTVREFAGTGIGLATAQRIVRRHGGRIWAEGAVGCGATFYFTLPGSVTRGSA
ncbi:MAG: PAS domain S-box protein [Minicystis sp.]